MCGWSLTRSMMRCYDAAVRTIIDRLLNGPRAHPPRAITDRPMASVTA